MDFDTWRRQVTRERVPDYVTDILRMEAAGQLTAAVYDVDIYHDDWCAIWRGGVCDCAPDVVVTEALPIATAGENCASVKG